MKLSKADLELIQRIRSGNYADKTIDPFEDWNYEVENKSMIHPLSTGSGYRPKRNFVPSKWERLKVSKFIQAIKRGHMKTIAEQKAEKEEKEKEADKCWDIWEDDSIVTWKPRKMPKPITAPKRDLPAHGESFNPPEEYLFDEKEKEEWHANDEEDRQTNYLPQKFEALRKVPLYENLIQEHFERCLDLYLCPRLLRKKVNVTDPTKLIPELPSPNDLKPFPTQVSFDFTFHKSPVRTIAISPNGLFLASGDEQHNLIIWCTRTTKILRKYELNHKVIDCIEWCPNVDYNMLAVTNEE